MPSTGVADMTLLSQVTNEQIRDNLGERFWNGVIYVRPELNSDKHWRCAHLDEPLQVDRWSLRVEYFAGVHRSKSYRDAPTYFLNRLPSFLITAEDSFRTLMNDKESQCVIISGESGAGIVSVD